MLPPLRCLEKCNTCCDFCNKNSDSENGRHTVGFMTKRNSEYDFGWISCNMCHEKAKKSFHIYEDIAEVNYFKKLHEDKTHVRVLRSSGDIEDNWLIGYQLSFINYLGNVMVRVVNNTNAITKTISLPEFFELNPRSSLSN